MTLDSVLDNQKVRTTLSTLLIVLLIFAVVWAAKHGLISAFFDGLGRVFLYLAHPSETHLPSFLERLNPTWIECN